MDWWSNWTSHVNYVNQTDIVSKKTKQLALDSSESSVSGTSNVVATSYSQLDSMTENHGLRPPSAADEVFFYILCQSSLNKSKYCNDFSLSKYAE